MYAVFEDGSRQYQVSVGDVVRVDFREAAEGDRVEFGRILLCKEGTEVKIGQPVLEGMRVVGEVVDHPSVKVYIQHFRKRKNYRRLKGHRQHYTAVKVQYILQAGQERAPAGREEAGGTDPRTCVCPCPEHSSCPSYPRHLTRTCSLQFPLLPGNRALYNTSSGHGVAALSAAQLACRWARRPVPPCV